MSAHLKFLFISFSFILTEACTNPPTKAEEGFSITSENEAGDFRGNKMGDGMSDVLDREGELVVYNLPDEITCRIPMDMKESTYYDVSYNFDEGKLNLIELEVFPKDSSDALKLFNQFLEHYRATCENEKTNKDLISWTRSSTRGTDIDVRLRSPKFDKDPPVISIKFYERH